MRLVPTIAGTAAAKVSTVETQALEVGGVCKQFGERRVLHDISLALGPREVLALCGPSGSGKTTLLRIIAGLIPFDAGRLAINGTAIDARAPYPARFYGRIGVIFQEHNLFPHLSALENVTLALRESRKLSVSDARARAMTELTRMGVEAHADRLPRALSGGERQRVAIARALAMDPLFLLLDEPTADLDPDRADEVCDRVLELAERGTTMVLVTHDVRLARQAAGTFALLRDSRCSISKDSALLDDLRASARHTR